MKTIRFMLMLILLVFLPTTVFCGNSDDSTNSRIDVEEKFVGVLIDQFGVKLENLYDDTNLREDFGADNTDMAELCMAVEEYFDIEIPDAKWAGVTTIKSAVDLIIDMKNSRYW